MKKKIKILSQIDLIKLSSSGNTDAKKELENRLKNMVEDNGKTKGKKNS
ncbi:hypothetical protein JYK00_01770 [Thermosipho ferrireducens]|uniref:Uncharacterized protein n=1 Tax=Thermosipho ferrireducens TaxID=2571116 RepID=A0ABX7S6T0_9BACT|nr:hypothetical protein [Thermosipho ferrireducens]QTA38292.1 hypothetical protein JYK00_01770 [Thermosipho ferrireducens]